MLIHVSSADVMDINMILSIVFTMFDLKTGYETVLRQH